jgi:hypothetical protein
VAGMTNTVAYENENRGPRFPRSPHASQA